MFPFDSGNSWKVVSSGTNTSALRAGKFKAGKALAETVKSIDNNGGGINSSTDYGATWSKDILETPCDLLATGGTVFDTSQCEDLQNGLLVYGGGGSGKATFKYMLSGNTFKGVLQPKWEGVNLEGILMVMRTIEGQTLIAETVTDLNGRFDLEIPPDVIGDVEIVSMNDWDRDWCPRPLPPDETILEPIEECDESTLQLRIISPEPVELNDLVFNGDSICAGTEITINWTGGDQAWNVLVYLIDVSTWAVTAVVNSSTINDGNEIWNIPSNFPAGTYQVYVQEENYATWVYGDVFTVKYCPADPVCLEECDHNLLRNWNFNENPIFGPMPLGSVSDWTRWPNSKSPDVSRIKCSSNDTVSIGMWGNGINGESIFQTLTTPFQPGQTYSISFMAMWRDIPGRPYPVQFEFRANNANHSSGFELGESYPNPFSQTTVIEYTLPHTEKVTIKVFDLYGREIKTLVDKAVHPGTHQIEWDASGLPTGTYFRMQAGRFSQTGKTTLHK